MFATNIQTWSQRVRNLQASEVHVKHASLTAHISSIYNQRDVGRIKQEKLAFNQGPRSRIVARSLKPTKPIMVYG
jgi:hypothetical protein